jgi:hypothetical protein
MDATYRKHKECNGIIKTYSTIALAKSAMERIPFNPLHSWEMEFFSQYHVTINSQLNNQNSIRYYIINLLSLLITVFCFRVDPPRILETSSDTIGNIVDGLKIVSTDSAVFRKRRVFRGPRPHSQL